MLDLAEYDQGLKSLADDVIANQRDLVRHLESLLKAKDNSATDLFEFRKYFLDDGDRKRIEPYLEIGFYSGESDDDRVVFFCLEFELESVARRIRLVNAFKAYDDSQTLFTHEPRLTDHIRVKGSRKGKPENEMVNYGALKQLHASEVLKFEESFVKLLPMLNPRIPEWIGKTFPLSPLFVRIDPDIASNNRLYQFLTEEIQLNPYDYRPESFRFQEAFLRPADHALVETTPTQETVRECLDYKVQGIRGLQASTSVNGTYRSFMIEELDDYSGPDGILIGRCIHCDSKEFEVTGAGEHLLDHLDLAINVYEQENRLARLNGSLRNGKVTDADYRTHVLRVDKVPLYALPMMGLLFMTSQVLFRRYLNDIGWSSEQEPLP